VSLTTGHLCTRCSETATISAVCSRSWVRRFTGFLCKSERAKWRSVSRTATFIAAFVSQERQHCLPPLSLLFPFLTAVNPHKLFHSLIFSGGYLRDYRSGPHLQVSSVGLYICQVTRRQHQRLTSNDNVTSVVR